MFPVWNMDDLALRLVQSRALYLAWKWKKMTQKFEMQPQILENGGKPEEQDNTWNSIY